VKVVATVWAANRNMITIMADDINAVEGFNDLQ